MDKTNESVGPAAGPFDSARALLEYEKPAAIGSFETLSGRGYLAAMPWAQIAHAELLWAWMHPYSSQRAMKAHLRLIAAAEAHPDSGRHFVIPLSTGKP